MFTVAYMFIITRRINHSQTSCWTVEGQCMLQLHLFEVSFKKVIVVVLPVVECKGLFFVVRWEFVLQEKHLDQNNLPYHQGYH